MRERGELLCDKLPQLPEAADPAAALAEIREAARVQGGGGKKAWSSEDVYDAFRDAAEELRDTIDKVADQTAFDPAAALPAAQAALQPPGGHARPGRRLSRAKDRIGGPGFRRSLDPCPRTA